MKKPYRTRAQTLINCVIAIRLALIARGASRNQRVDWQRCKDFQQQTAVLMSDRQWAGWLSGNVEWLREITSPRNRSFLRELLDLQLEAMEILNQK